MKLFFTGICHLNSFRLVERVLNAAINAKIIHLELYRYKYFRFSPLQNPKYLKVFWLLKTLLKNKWIYDIPHAKSRIGATSSVWFIRNRRFSSKSEQKVYMHDILHSDAICRNIMILWTVILDNEPHAKLFSSGAFLPIWCKFSMQCFLLF